MFCTTRGEEPCDSTNTQTYPPQTLSIPNRRLVVTCFVTAMAGIAFDRTTAKHLPVRMTPGATESSHSSPSSRGLAPLEFVHVDSYKVTALLSQACKVERQQTLDETCSTFSTPLREEISHQPAHPSRRRAVSGPIARPYVGAVERSEPLSAWAMNTQSRGGYASKPICAAEVFEDRMFRLPCPEDMLESAEEGQAESSVPRSTTIESSCGRIASSCATSESLDQRRESPAFPCSRSLPFRGLRKSPLQQSHALPPPPLQ